MAKQIDKELVVIAVVALVAMVAITALVMQGGTQDARTPIIITSDSVNESNMAGQPYIFFDSQNGDHGGVYVERSSSDENQEE